MKGSKYHLFFVGLSIMFGYAVLLNGCAPGGSQTEIETTGTVEMTEITIGSKIGGKVDRIIGEEGRRVKKGEILAWLDHEELDAQIAAARANLEVAKANLELAQIELRRTEKLYQDQLVSQSQYDQAVTRVEVLKAQTRQAEANIALLETQLKNVVICAPISGIISEKLVEAGEIVTPGSPVFIILEDTRPWVQIYLPLAQVEQVFLNQKAYIRMDAYPDRKIPGRIFFISQKAEFTPKNLQTKEERIKQVYAVKIELDNTDGILKAGMPVDVWIEKSEVAGI